MLSHDSALNYSAIIVVNQKRAALLTVQYEVILSEMTYMIDRGNMMHVQFQRQAAADGPKPITPTPGQKNKIGTIKGLLETRNYSSDLFFPPSPNTKIVELANKLLAEPSQNGTFMAETINSSTYKDLQKALDEGMADPTASPASVQMFSAGKANLNTTSTVQALGQLPTPPSPMAIASYGIPIFGQVKAGVDALEGLGESVAKFYSLFRDNENISGVSLKIPTEALNALVINRLKLEMGHKLRCYSADFIPDQGEKSKIMKDITLLTASSDEISDDLGRIDITGGQIIPDPNPKPDAFNLSIPRNLDAYLDALQAYVKTLPQIPPDTSLDDQKKALQSSLKVTQKQLQTYVTAVDKLLTTLYGTSGSKDSKGSGADAEDSKPPSPAAAFSGTNQSANVAAPITITPTISPVVTINTGGTNPTAQSTEKGGKEKTSPGSASDDQETGPKTAAASAPPPLAAILTEEALCERLKSGYLLYVNVLSTAGANKTSNGWWNSETLYNAGVAVDFFLTSPGGEVLASSSEDAQSPYLVAGHRGWGERLPTVVTTNNNIRTKTDIDDVDDAEPESRFSLTPVLQSPANDEVQKSKNPSRR